MNSVMEKKKVFSALTMDNTKEVFIEKVWNITKTKAKKNIFRRETKIMVCQQGGSPSSHKQTNKKKRLQWLFQDFSF